MSHSIPRPQYLNVPTVSSLCTVLSHNKMWTTLRRTLPLALLGARLAIAEPSWTFELQDTRSGIVALEAIVVSPTLVVFFDRASNDPLQINNHSAWGALWDLETSTVQPLNVLTNSFCASGALLSNGTMVCIDYYSCLSLMQESHIVLFFYWSG